MIKIEVDEAYAFDMLAIALIKVEEGNSMDYFSNLLEDIRDSVGLEIFYKVYLSEEFSNLYEANRRVYLYIEELSKGDLTITASDIHSANMDRYKYKKQLQNKFFGTTLSEQKTV